MKTLKSMHNSGTPFPSEDSNPSKNQNVEHNLIKWLSIVAIKALLITACGTSSQDPLKDYKDIKQVIPHRVKSDTQVFARPVLFTLKVLGSNNEADSIAHFTEGFRGKVLFEVTPQTPLIQDFEVKLTKFNGPDDVSITRENNTNNKHIFSLTWLPKVGTIPPSLKTNLQFAAEIQMIITKAEESLLNGQFNTKTISINLNRSQEQPRIATEISELKAGVLEKKAILFSFIVEDPVEEGAVSGLSPTVIYKEFPYTNTEAYYPSAHSYLKPELVPTMMNGKKPNPEFIERKGNFNKWRFYNVIKIDTMPLPKDNKGKDSPLNGAQSIKICLKRVVQGSLGNFSIEIDECFDGLYGLKKPQFTWKSLPSEPMETASTSTSSSVSGSAQGSSPGIVQGSSPGIAPGSGPLDIIPSQSVDLSLSATLTDKIGQLNINNFLLQLENTLKKLPGTFSKNCSNDNLNTELNCTVDWTPSCTLGNKTLTGAKHITIILTIDATSDNGKKESAAINRDFRLNCPVGTSPEPTKSRQSNIFSVKKSRGKSIVKK